jgi:hypothetical protein
MVAFDLVMNRKPLKIKLAQGGLTVAQYADQSPRVSAVRQVLGKQFESDAPLVG